MSVMLEEACSAPARVAHLLAQDEAVYSELGRRLRELDPAVAVTVARGSSDHAATYFAYLVPSCTGRPVSSLPPSLVTVLECDLRLGGQLALAISQSGASPDIIRAMERARSSGALTAALVNAPDSALASAVEVVLPQHAWPENAVAATKSVICSMAAMARLVAAWSQDAALTEALARLPQDLEQAVQVGLNADAGALAGVSHVYTLSRGLGFGLAHELSLKLKETCGLHAEAFSVAEVRHGPREIVDERFLILAVALPGSGQDDVLAAAAELEAQGARVLRLAPEGDLPLPAFPDSRLAPIVALQLLYPWLARACQALGRDPDRMKHLTSKVVKTV